MTAACAARVQRVYGHGPHSASSVSRSRMPTLPSLSKSGGQGVAHLLRAAGAAGVATEGRAPRGQHRVQVERVNTPIRPATRS